jgi:hypothetical protein
LSESLRIGDRSTGTTVLSDLYAKWKDRAVEVDLASMWKDLGIASQRKSVHMAEDAPLAAIRRGITEPTASKESSSQTILPSAVFAGRAVAGSRRAL